MTLARHEPKPGFFRVRLPPDGYIGLHLTAGTVTLLVAAMVFGPIAEDVFNADAIVTPDLQVSNWFYVYATPALTAFLLFFTPLYGTLGALALSLLSTLFLVKKRARGWVFSVALYLPLGMFNVLPKNIFQRTRQAFEPLLLKLKNFSFQSDHASAVTLVYGLAGDYLVCTSQGRRRGLVVCLAVGLVTLVGLRRIVLGTHYLNDVAATIALTSVAIWRKRQTALTQAG